MKRNVMPFQLSFFSYSILPLMERERYGFYRKKIRKKLPKNLCQSSIIVEKMQKSAKRSFRKTLTSKFVSFPS